MIRRLFALTFLCLPFVVANAYGGLRVVADKSMPYPERYVVVRDIAQPHTFFFLPLQLALVRGADGRPRFGLQHSGYSSVDPSGRAAMATITFRLQSSSSDLAGIRARLAELFGKTVELKPLPAFQYSVRLVTPTGRAVGASPKIVYEGASTADATTSVNFDLDELSPSELYDFFSANAGLGGMIVEFSFSLDAATPRTIIASTESLRALFVSIGVSRADGGLRSLAERILSVAHDREMPDATLGESETQAILTWLEQVLPLPEIKRELDDESIFLGWDLAGKSVQSVVGQDETISWRVPTASGGGGAFYSAFTFTGFCAEFPGQFVDLTNMKAGCDGFAPSRRAKQ